MNRHSGHLLVWKNAAALQIALSCTRMTGPFSNTVGYSGISGPLVQQHTMQLIITNPKPKVCIYFQTNVSVASVRFPYRTQLFTYPVRHLSFVFHLNIRPELQSAVILKEMLCCLFLILPRLASKFHSTWFCRVTLLVSDALQTSHVLRENIYAY